jgi:hypothetical protein
MKMVTVLPCFFAALGGKFSSESPIVCSVGRSRARRSEGVVSEAKRRAPRPLTVGAAQAKTKGDGGGRGTIFLGEPELSLGFMF